MDLPLWQREGESPIFADFAAKIGAVPVNGYEWLRPDRPAFARSFPPPKP